MSLSQNTSRKGFPMTESTRYPSNQASAIVPQIVTLLHAQLQFCLDQFHQQPITPANFHHLETQMQAQLQAAGRLLLEQTLRQLEPDTIDQASPRITFQNETYRRRPKQPKTIYSSFGPIEYTRFRYEGVERGQTSLFPLDLQLGLEAHLATPVLAERVGRLAVDHEQRQVLATLVRDHGVCWSVNTLRKVTAALSDGMASFREEAQTHKALGWLKQAFQSKGRHRPVLTVGRDGIMVPMRNQGFKEASSATIAIYSRRGKRIGTIYLGFMPQAGQTTMTEQLTALLRRILSEWHAQQGSCPRLAYLTDGGHHPREYFKKVLQKMADPWNCDPKQTLSWQWILDYWHVCGYVNKLATTLFGDDGKAYKWFATMRRWLRDRRRGITNILRSATQYQALRKLTEAQEEAFYEAYRFLCKNSRFMQYADYRRQGMPIGSGITEAACKTVFTQRLKRSGMSWHKAGGQKIVNLRVLHLSGVWKETHAKYLNTRDVPKGGSQKGSAGKISKKAG
jgi:hypothetical protein